MRSRYVILTLTLAVVVIAGITAWRTTRTEAGTVIEVDRNDDVIASACTAADDDCSLRGAISLANLLPGLDTIQVPADTYTLTIPGAGNDNNATGDLDITDAVSISGDGENNTFIEAGASAATAIDRVFHIVSPGGSAGIMDMTVRHGMAAGGGAILVEGSLEMSDVAVRNSSDTGFNSFAGGGGVMVTGDASAFLLEVTIADNDAGFGGGFLKNDGTGSWSITDSVVTGNNSAASGGGLFLGQSSSAVLTDVQVTNNEVMSGDGGGIWIGSDVISIIRGSVSGNSATGRGGGILAPSDILIDGTLISGNMTAGLGGGFNGSGTIMNAIITGNSAMRGGGMDATDVQLIDTAVTGNDATVGGGIAIDGNLTATGVTVSGNNATQLGGGLYLDNDEFDAAELTNTTISGNDAIVQGGGIWRDDIANDRVAGAGGGPPRPTGPVSLLHVTVADNTSDVGSAIFDGNDDEDFEVMSTIVSGNTGGPTCSGELQSLGYNIDDGTSCGFTFIGDQENTDPLLMDLGNNGGTTDTHALTALSPAINAANPACPPPGTDQRGVARPINDRCDVGAFETDEPGPPTPTPSPTPGVTETPAITAAPSATPTATPTPTPGTSETPGPGRVLEWGDNQCDEDLDPVDSLGTLRFVASLSPVDQTEPCAEIGDDVDVQDASIHPWGDTDCDDDVDTVDALAILRVVAGLVPLLQTEPCPDIGDEVVVTET